MRLVDAKPIEKFITDGLNNKEKPYGWIGVEILTEVHYAPTVDVAPVVHAEWKKVSDKYPRYVCTACNHLYNNKEYKFCPFCGADMRKGSKTASE